MNNNACAIICLGLGLLMAPGSDGEAQPANDNFADRIALAGTNFSVQGDNAAATTEPGENLTYANLTLAATVWYSWNVPTNGVVFLSGTSTNPAFAVMLTVYRGSSLNGLSQIHPRLEGGFSVNAGETIEIRVASGYNPESNLGGGTGPFMLGAQFFPKPANDDFAYRTALSGTNILIQGDNTAASVEAGETGVVGSLWYSWTADTNGVVYFSAQAADPGFSFGIFAGAALNGLGPPPNRTQDGGWGVQPGETFQLQVASVDGVLGPFELGIHMIPRVPASTNDLFASRLEMLLPTYHFEGSIYGATNEPGEPLPSSTTHQTLWWHLLPPDDGVLHVKLTTPYPVSLAVYEGTDFASMTPLTAGYDYRYHVWAGVEYAVQVASDLVPSGNIVMDSTYISLTNDMFGGREFVVGTNWSFTGNVSFATREPNEPMTNWANTVWLSWTAPVSGRAWLSGSANAAHDYAVYIGDSLEQLQSVPIAGVVQNLRTMQVFAGTTYHFQFAGGPDDFLLQLTELNPYSVHATNDSFADAEVLKGELVDYADPKSFADATMEPGEPLHAGTVNEKSLWWKWQAPRYGYLTMSPQFNVVTNPIVFAIYQGTSVSSLALLGSGTNSVRVPVNAGETYYVAVAVSADTIGDIIPYVALTQTVWGGGAVHPVPGNLLVNPSFEMETQGWNTTPGFGAYVNEGGGADGSTWPIVPGGGKLWQNITTIPGHDYGIRFAYRADGCCGDRAVRILWDENEVGVAYCPGDDSFWHWANYTARASNTLTRIAWTNLNANLQMDAFSVIDLNAPPVITKQPDSFSTLANGTVAFQVDSLGTRPLYYQWWHGAVAVQGGNGPILVLHGVTEVAAGTYTVVITNNYGAVTSTVASLTVEAPTNATIIFQPYGDAIPQGGYYNLSVVAAGQVPLRYQWLQDGVPLAGATSAALTFTNISVTNAGKYQVLVSNDFSSVISLPAYLVVTNALGGGMIECRNRSLGLPSVSAPVYDVDGTTPLSGPAYLAQLYVGASLAGLRPVSVPIPFRTNSISLGYFAGSSVTLAAFAPGSIIFAQVRSWESAMGSSYEEARARGGKFGKSNLLQIQLPGANLPPTPLVGLGSFNLQAGLPSFTVGIISFLDHLLNGDLLWSLQGQGGFSYLIEKSVPPADPIWRPFMVLTNSTGVVTFTDTPTTNAQTILYRSRILN